MDLPPELELVVGCCRLIVLVPVHIAARSRMRRRCPVPGRED